MNTATRVQGSDKASEYGPCPNCAGTIVNSPALRNYERSCQCKACGDCFGPLAVGKFKEFSAWCAATENEMLVYGLTAEQAAEHMRRHRAWHQAQFASGLTAAAVAISVAAG